MAYEEIRINDTMRLVQLQTEQADRLFELTDNNRQYLGEFLAWLPYVKTAEDSRRHIEETLSNRDEGKSYTYGIEVDGQIVGDISLRNLQADAASPPEIGYWIAKDQAGRGVTTLAVKALTDFGIDELGLSQIVILAEPNNIGSNKVAAKNGYVRDGEVDDETRNITLNRWSYSR